jgi:hypothetical protein
VEVLRTSFLQPYEQKWLGRDGLAHCQIFDEVLARNSDDDQLIAPSDGPLE